MQISVLFEQTERLLQHTSLDFKRYLHRHVRWQNRLIGIKGSRGTGKTTLLLQWLKMQDLPSSQAAYFSLDDLYFSQNSLKETVAAFHRQGGKLLALDEVHKYPRWAQEIKNIYDFFPDLRIVFTGSSVVDISRQEGDLSRRALMYELPGLSYREYLEMVHGLKLPVLTLPELTGQAQQFRKRLPASFRPLEHFQQYVETGYYPFLLEDPAAVYPKVNQLIRTVVEYDMVELKDFDYRNAKKVLQLMYVIAQQVPFKPNITSLAEQTNIHRNTLGSYLHYLEQARLIHLMHPAGRSTATLQKPEKIYLNNTNLMYALAERTVETGTMRETFFLQHVSPMHRVQLPKAGDFIVDGKYTFEVGGKAKTRKQIADVDDAYVVRDDMDYPTGNELPLWMLGMLY